MNRSKEEVKELASKGGKASGGTGNSASGHDDDDNSNSGKGKQGFASMDPDKQVCLMAAPPPTSAPFPK